MDAQADIVEQSVERSTVAAQWRLFSAPTSPFVRKVRIVLLAKGLASRVVQVPCDPFAEEEGFVAVNPVAQVPALDLGRRRLIGSDLICRYFDQVGEGPRLVPEGDAQWDVLARQAIADGVMECAVRLRSESKRDEAQRSPRWTARWLRGIDRGLDELQRTLPAEGALDLGVIAAVCACTYLGFRHPHIDWRAGRSRLAERVEALERSAVFETTQPDKPLE